MQCSKQARAAGIPDHGNMHAEQRYAYCMRCETVGTCAVTSHNGA